MNVARSRSLVRWWYWAGLASLLAGVSILWYHSDQATRGNRYAENAMQGEGSRAVDSGVVTPVDAEVQSRTPGDAKIQAKPQRLFAFIERPSWAGRLEDGMPSPARDVRYVVPDRSLFRGKQSPFWQRAGEGRLEIATPDGRRLTVAIKGSQQLASDRMVSEGWIEGQPASRFILAMQEVADGPAQITATVTDVMLAEGENPAAGEVLQNFTLRATGSEEAQYYRVDDSRVHACGGEPRAERLAMAQMQGSAATPASLRGRTVAEDAALAGGAPVVLDLLLLYSGNVLEGMIGSTTAVRVAAVQSVLDAAVAEANSDMARSGMGVALRLVKTAQVSYDETASDYSKVNSDALKALKLTSDGKLDEVHALRDQVGADLVSFAVISRDNTSSGIGYLLSTPSFADPGDALQNDQWAFSVVQFNALNGTSLLAHELGHNLGAQHDRENSRDSSGATQSGAFSYSHGHRFYGRNGVQYRTIMAYAPGTRVHYFSNPDIVASESGIGVSVGVSLGQIGESHNALTIQRCAFEVSSFRLQRVDTADRGTLVNVSTRAWVGIGERQLIGGFMVEGSGEKRVLVRALGAGLARFGVTDGLPNPRLTLYRLPSGIQEAANDDWTGQSNAAEITSVGAMLGAFGMDSAKDAALLLRLAPGSYTANIESVDGALGSALLEAYEVDAGAGAKLINLSTRAWSEKGKPVIAGFVVRGTAGQTKRTLVRVLGPTLNLAGVSEAMHDPRLDLYKADGTWVMANDDWTIGASYVSGQRDDFKPLVQYYREKEIDQTGLAPKNRREPALLLDLEPGLYTAIVQPFESEANQQESSPGVAIVEVYEIRTP